MLKVKNNKGQSTLEYAILIIIIIGALLTIQVYIKRGLQGRWKQATDDIGDQYTQADGANYFRQVNKTSNTTETVQAGVTQSDLRADSQTTKFQNITHNSFGEFWGENN